MSKEPNSEMTVLQLFNAVKNSPMDIIFSFKEKGKRYQLSAISVGVLDPMLQIIRGAVIICFDPDSKPREDRFHFKLVTAKLYVWAYKKPLEKKSVNLLRNPTKN